MHKGAYCFTITFQFKQFFLKVYINYSETIKFQMTESHRELVAMLQQMCGSTEIETGPDACFDTTLLMVYSLFVQNLMPSHENFEFVI